MRHKDKWVFLIALTFVALASAYALEYNISVPEEVNSGKWFDVNVSVYSNNETNFSVYAYVYKGFECFGQGWTSNKKEILLQAGESKDFTLSDLVKYNTPEGYYNLRVRFRLPDNQNITETYNLKVVSESSFKEIYLYAGLIALCVVGIIFALKYNK
jgi:hypothetical protein